MSAQTRKLLVKQYPDKQYRVMLERTDRTLTLQIPEKDGEDLMTALESTIVDLAVQKGWIRP